MHEGDEDGAPHEEDRHTHHEQCGHQLIAGSNSVHEEAFPEVTTDPLVGSPGENTASPEHDTSPGPLAKLVDEVSALKSEIREYHSRAAARERIIDNLHAEVERLRTGEQSLLLRPIVTDLQNLRRDLLNQARTLNSEIDRERVAGLLDSYALSIELTLERCGSVPFRPAVADQFVAREHRAVKAVPADNPEQDGTIVAVMADGYRDTETDRVTVPARVHVYRWTPVDSSDAAQEEESADA